MAGLPPQFFLPPNPYLAQALAAGGMNLLSPAAGSLNLPANLFGWSGQFLPTYGVPNYGYLSTTGLQFMDPTVFLAQALGIRV